MSNMTMGQRIAQQRKMLGLSQEGLGEKVGVSRQAISKWESDGTVPEIDKLIVLSKLFSVSVGWLLGVEENAPQSDELTEAQLKTVEEIVKRYHPASEPEEKEFRWFPLVLAFLFLFPIAYFFFSRNTPDYSDQISSLQSGYQTIQSQLQSLSGKVEDIATAAEESEKLLQSHQFQLLKLGTGYHSLESVGSEMLLDGETDHTLMLGTATLESTPIAELTFSAIPKTHIDTDRAWLVVLLNGQPFGQAECIWAGSEYMAKFSLRLEDGYEYRFVVEHADGNQQIQMLEEYDHSSLAYGTSLHCTVDSFTWDFDAKSWIFRIGDCSVFAEKPYLGTGSDAQWAESGLIFYRNGEEIERNVLPVQEDAGSECLIANYCDSNATRRSIKLEEGDELKLTFYAALDDGQSMEAAIGHWRFQGGNLILLPEE